jgi:hypothetical protein
MRDTIPQALWTLALLWIVLPALLPLACGRRGPPVPPRTATPAAVTTIRAEPRDSAIIVTWVRPTRTEAGSPLTDLAEFRLFRAMGSPAPVGAQERAAFSLLATIRAEQPDNATVQGDQYAFRDDGGGPGFTPGVRYTYRVQAVNRRGQAGPPSVEAFVDYILAPAAPTGLVASAGDGVVDLTWQAPAAPAPAGVLPPQGYHVYRAVRPGDYPAQPVNAVPIVETRFRDSGVENGTTYYYVVRSAGTERPPWRESANSNEVSATPMDLTPPAPPRGLTAVPGVGTAALSWDANPEPDLLGYLVYRREPPAQTPVRLTEIPIQATSFTDRAVQPGKSYVYTVTAVDRSPRRNESAPSSEVSASLP